MMGRPRRYATNAEKQAAYRVRQHATALSQIHVVQGEHYILYQGDAWRLLAALPGVDVVLTDPPFAAQTHAGARGGGLRQTRLISFAPFTEAAAVRLVRRACALARRWVVLTMDWRHAHAVERACPELFVRAGIWVKRNAAPQFSGDRPGTGWESVVICHRPGKKTWNGGGHHAVWDLPRAPSTHHPTEKPLALLADWVAQFSHPGDVILDPFMGAGTTGLACLAHQRRFIGIERDPDYFGVACQQLALASAPGPLFPAPRPATQAPLL